MYVNIYICTHIYHDICVSMCVYINQYINVTDTYELKASRDSTACPGSHIHSHYAAIVDSALVQMVGVIAASSSLLLDNPIPKNMPLKRPAWNPHRLPAY